MQAIDQIINSAAKQLYMSGGQVQGADRVPRPQRRRGARRRAAQPGLFGLVQPRPRPLRHRALSAPPTPRACSRPRSARNNPVVFLENEILYGSTGLVPKVDDFVLPIGKARIARPGQGRDHRLVLDGHALRHPGDREAGRRRRRRRTDRPAHAAPDGQRHRHRVGQEDRPPGDGRRGLAAGRHRRRARRPRHGARPSTISMRPSPASPARTCRCPTPPTSKSWRCRTSTK